MQIHKVEQKTDEWYALRRGRLTASEAQAIGNNGKGLETLVLCLMAEKYASVQEEKYNNGDMDRGNELEAQARSIYELERGVTVEQVGFISEGDYAGCSPDGLIGEDGGIEIKCPNNVKYFSLLLNGEKAIDTAYIWQVQMNLLLTGRKWWDLVFYSPNYTESMKVFRIVPDKKMHEALKEGLKIGELKIKEIEKKYER